MTDHLPGDLEDRIRDAYQSAARTVQPHTLRRTSPMRAAGSVPRSRRMTAFIPIAAAMAVILAIGASVALPRLLAGIIGSSPNPATQQISAPAHYPPFLVVVTVSNNNRDSRLLVESAATGHVASTLATPWQGDMWIAVAATADAMKFIAATQPASSPYAPTRLYTLTLSARGTVTGLTPLAVPAIPGVLTALAASADGNTVGYTTVGPGNVYEAGVITGGRTRQWSVPAGIIAGIVHVSVSSDGGMLAFITSGVGSGGVVEDTAWVLPTAAAPGSITARARKVYDHSYVGGAGQAVTILNSSLISPDGRTVYLCTTASPASGMPLTRVTAYSTADGASLGTIATWDGAYPTMLAPVGGMLLSWEQDVSTAYLIDPATRTRATLRLRGIPRAQYVTLAW